MTIHHRIIIFLILFLPAATLFAQADTRENGLLKDTEIIIQKERVNQLPESTRLFKKAPLPPLAEKTNLSLHYQLYDLPFPFQTLAHRIKVLRDQPDQLHRLYGNYLAIGHGNYWSPALTLFLDNIKNHTYTYGLHIDHLSEGKKKYGEEYHHQAGLHGKLWIGEWTLGGAISYEGDKYPYIQTINNQKETENDSSLHETYHQVHLTTSLYTYKADTLNYGLALEMIHYRNKPHHWHENQGQATFQAGYRLNEITKLQAEAQLHISKYQSESPTPGRFVSTIKPVANLVWGDFIAEGGVKLAYQNDKTALPNNFYLYPDLNITYQWNKALRPYIGISGDLQKQTWYDYTSKNPWLISSAKICYTNQPIIFSLGAHSDWPLFISSHAGIQVINEQNAAFFVNEPSSPRQFNLQYDPSATTVKLFGSAVKQSFGEAVTTRLDLAVFYYNFSQLKIPHHRPAYTIELHNHYNFHDKILFKNTLYGLGGLKTIEPTKEATVQLPLVLDLGFGIEYIWNERFSILLNVYNLLARENRRYLHIPTDGLHGWLGISYGF